MICNKTITGIILVAGNSTRYGKNVNKNFEKINTKSVLSYSLNCFNLNKYIDNILLVIRKKDTHIVEDIIKEEKINKNVLIVYGGKSRQESVFNGLCETNDDIVIIHDGARPAIKDTYICDLLKEMDNYNGTTIGVKAKDTIKIADENGIIINTTKRSNTWLIQTPQCFNRKILFNLHKKYKSEEVTDDCMLLEKDGYKVKIIEGDYTNIKVTTNEDINILKEYLK